MTVYEFYLVGSPREFFASSSFGLTVVILSIGKRFPDWVPKCWVASEGMVGNGWKHRHDHDIA